MKRMMRSGFVGFWRNSFVSLASVVIMVVTLVLIAVLIFGSAILSASLEKLRGKVDVTVYFNTDAPESEILSLKKSLEAMSEVGSVSYTSREKALEDFKVRHQGDELTLQALDELGENPLGASLNVLARATSEYEGIAKFLSGQDALGGAGHTIIDKVNYAENKTAIDKLSKVIDSARAVGIAIVLLFAFISVLITFNTIQIVIYTARDEISLMRLVGASPMYIRGPFVVAGMMYGAAAGLLTLLLLVPFVWWLSPMTDAFGTGVRLVDYYRSNFLEVFFIILGSGVFLGASSAFLAVKKFLKV